MHWVTPEFRARQAEHARQRWSDPEHRLRVNTQMSRCARAEDPPLTPEQARQFPALVRAGYAPKEIARRLGTSNWRVMSHAFGLVQRTLCKR